MTTSLAGAREAATSRLWPIPTAAVVVALLLGVAFPALDSTVDEQLSERTLDWLFGGDADAARSLLGVIASSLITVTSLTFSLTVVSLQLASSQFSPRLLRTFTSDAFVQATLGVFLATFTYALTVLRAVRSGDDGQIEVVPRISVTVAFVLAVVSVLVLVLFLAHLSEQIRVETVLNQVRENNVRAIRRILGEPSRTSANGPTAPLPPEGALPLVAATSGFLTGIVRRRLLEITVEEDAVVALDVQPGDFVVEGTAVGSAWSAGDDTMDQASADRLAARAAACLTSGPEPTATEDVRYGLRQLADIATKALSPGINDPTTAIHALHHIGVVLSSLADHDLTAEMLHDENGRARVVLARPDLQACLDLALTQPRRDGAANPQVMATILTVLLNLSQLAGPQHRVPLHLQLERVRATAGTQSFDSFEAASLAALGARVQTNLTGPDAGRSA